MRRTLRTLAAGLLVGSLVVLVAGTAAAQDRLDERTVPVAVVLDQAVDPHTRLAAESPAPTSTPTAGPHAVASDDRPAPALIVVGVLLSIAAIAGAIARYRSIRP